MIFKLHNGLCYKTQVQLLIYWHCYENMSLVLNRHSNTVTVLL